MKKFFIVGCPRSGTTMVQQALNRHSRITIPPETKYFFSFLGHSRNSQERHVERLNRDLKIQLQLPPSGVRSDDAARAFYDGMARQYVERLGKKRVNWFGEKTPEHTGRLAQIRELYPDARIVVLYRDGRDVALSLTKTPWMGTGLYASFVVWLYYQRLVMQAQSSGWSNLYFASYESLVSRPEEELGGILDFLDLPHEAAVAGGCGNSEGIPKREYAWKAGALEKITPDRVGTFRNELNPTEIAILERLGQQTLTSFGYPLQTDGKAPLSLGFRLKLACELGTFASRLPWYSAARELLYRFRQQLSGAMPRAIPSCQSV